MSDTQGISAPPGLPYGSRKQLEDAQRVTPVAGAQLPTKPSQAQGRPALNLPSGAAPGDVPSLDDPSAYPDEPVTAGLAIGAGPGPESTLTGAFGSESLSLLRSVYALYRDPDVRRLIEATELNQ